VFLVAGTNGKFICHKREDQFSIVSNIEQLHSRVQINPDLGSNLDYYNKA